MYKSYIKGRKTLTVVAELAELELLVAAVAEVAERSHAEVPMGCWIGIRKMGVDCNSMEETCTQSYGPSIQTSRRCKTTSNSDGREDPKDQSHEAVEPETKEPCYNYCIDSGPHKPI